MSMLSVVTLMDLTIAHVKLDILEMAKVVLVSCLIETGNVYVLGLKSHLACNDDLTGLY